jgi:hypothetical protein
MRGDTVFSRANEAMFSDRHYLNRLSYRRVALNFRVDVSIRRGKSTL